MLALAGDGTLYEMAASEVTAPTRDNALKRNVCVTICISLGNWELQQREWSMSEQVVTTHSTVHAIFTVAAAAGVQDLNNCRDCR